MSKHEFHQGTHPVIKQIDLVYLARFDEKNRIIRVANPDPKYQDHWFIVKFQRYGSDRQAWAAVRDREWIPLAFLPLPLSTSNQISPGVHLVLWHAVEEILGTADYALGIMDYEIIKKAISRFVEEM